MCFMSHHYFPCTSHASLRGTGECVWCRLLGERSPPLKKEEMDSQRNSSKASPSDFPGGRDSQQFSPALETSFASIPLIACLAGLAVSLFLCLYSAAAMCLLSHHGWGRSDRFLTIYGVRLEAGQTFIGSKCGGVQSTTTSPPTHTTATTMIELVFIRWETSELYMSTYRLFTAIKKNE